jgi:hypothetical protein
MAVLNKISWALYFFLWLLCISCAFMYVSDRLYSIGRILGPLVGLLTVFVTVVVFTVLLILYFRSSLQRRSYKRGMIFSLSPIIPLSPFLIILLTPNKLEDKTHTIDLNFIPYACDCANWRINKIDHLEVHLDDIGEIYLEPQIPEIGIPDSVSVIGTTIEVVGRFYKWNGFPTGYHSEEIPDKARVFQYSDYKVMSEE